MSAWFLFLVATCASMLISCNASSESTMNQPLNPPPVDLNKPVQNPGLDAALDELTPQQGLITQETVVRELNRAYLLLPMVHDLPTNEARQSGVLAFPE